MYNFFTSFNILHALQQSCIYAAGTIRINRFVNSPFMSDKDLKKMDHGTAFEVSSDMLDINIGLVK